MTAVTGAHMPVGTAHAFRQLAEELEAGCRTSRETGWDWRPLQMRADWCHGAGRLAELVESRADSRELERALAELRRLWARPLEQLAELQRRRYDDVPLVRLDDEGAPDA